MSTITVVHGEHPVVAEWLRSRRELGQDHFDEVWEGVYHVAPNAGTEHGQVSAQVLVALAPLARREELISSGPFNLGTGEGKKNYRVPDGGWFHEAPHGTYASTAAAVLEVLSPDDESYDKFGFYFTWGVEEILVVHPIERWLKLYSRGDHFQTDRGYSALFGITMQDLAAEILWP